MRGRPATRGLGVGGELMVAHNGNRTPRPLFSSESASFASRCAWNEELLFTFPKKVKADDVDL